MDSIKNRKDCKIHEWMTHFVDCSGNGGMDDWFETMSGRYDAQVIYKCHRCDKRDGASQEVRASIEMYGYGSGIFPGRLTLGELDEPLKRTKGQRKK